MDPLWIARLQFASTTIFHYFFVPVSIGLAFIIAIMQTIYVKKGDEMYKRMTKFFGHLFLINFAVGVVTGILQEFQFGMNWSTYSRFVGDVFGPSLAIEGLLAFFMESTFIGLWVFGWDRLSKRVHLISIWLVSIGTMLSAFWILSANSFMQAPVGYEIAADGRAQMNDFFAIIKNPQLWVQFPHVLVAALATGAFLVAGISAWKIGKKHDITLFKKSFKIAVIVAAVSSLCLIITGHREAQHLIETQPMKLAAAEALWETADPAPFTAIAHIDTENQENKFALDVPYALSFLSYNKFTGQVKGLLDLQKEYTAKYGPGDYIPPVKTTFWSFRTMVLSAVFMVLLSLYGWIQTRKDKLASSPKYLKLMLWGMSLPFIGNTAGWIMTEMGRQPWVVFGVMKTEDAVSPSVTANEVLFSFISFTLIYAVLAAVSIYLFVRFIKKNDQGDKKETISTDPFDKEVTEVVPS
ncbi:cytochrome ubiquinol oxidase subunit I [Virgibacillus soli]|uniref:Cytochrome ubiquinol oxidase subunit I n=1 Tax=Paracerasibacillus soli TaxID=480284 RepID=A0ABU5CUI3_9BACI|nr:cytochrome ubiquinol oxidase subunit I [Virgibacillus soli]MDY0409073.1 cytochrome ubiquinol oxidase subunit I [Virgibacillus soli]